MTDAATTAEPAGSPRQAVGASRGYLGALLADRTDRRRAAWVAGLLIAAFALTAGQASLPLPAVPMFVPAYDAAMLVLNLITALMLHAQYRDLHQRGFLWLACGYLYGGLFALTHGLGFPDAFVAGSLFGGGQTLPWLWTIWHGVAPLFVAAYALSMRAPVRPPVFGAREPELHRLAYPATVALVALLVWSTVTLEQWLPVLLDGERYRSAATRWIAAGAVGSHLLAMGLLVWRTRLGRLVDLWLCVTLIAAIIELALSGLLITGRYQLGFYVGRVYGLLGALFMLTLLMRHALLLHGRLVRASAALHESERRFRDLFDSMGEAFYVVEAVTDEEGHVVDLEFLQENPTARHYVGRDVVGRRLAAVQPEFEFDWVRIVEDVVRSGRDAAFERPSPLTGRYFQYRVFRLEGRPRQVGILFQDIKPRRDTEKALRDSEERFRQFGQASSGALWIRDARTLRMEYISPAFEAMSGRSNDEVAGSGIESWDAMLHPDDRDTVQRNMRRVLDGERVKHEFRIVQAETQDVRWIQSTDFPMRDVSCRINRIGGIAQDVTALKKAQARLLESEACLRSAIQVGRLATWDWNLATGKVAWSDDHYRLEGYERGEVTPSYEAWIARVHPEDRDAAESAVQHAMETGEEYVREVRFVHPDGTVRWADARGRFFYDAAGAPIRMIGAMIDTTQRREWEEAQRVLVAELQHRTRNLIAVVRSIADRTLRESGGMEDFSRVFSERLGALARVQGLLSRLKDGQRVSFDELLGMELAAHLDAREGAGRITTEGPADVALRSSSVQPLALAVHELITNAIKYGALKDPAGHLRVRWRVEAEDGRPWLHVDWRETGVAMPADEGPMQGGGAGRELIERALPYQFGARTTYALTPDGVHCTVAMPISTHET
ncbi:MAG TPA: PAS domain-containing protein [Lysobacter sp.]